ncbi:hypothetical protein K3495_g11370 [Podosphaera aphanis]|nr:hypothetical protein K3495_g11370 [Podosphaera aphanis]
MHGQTFLLALVAFTFSTGVIAAPRPASLDIKRSPSNTLPVYEVPAVPHARRAAPTGTASAAGGATAAAPEAEPAAAGNPFTQVLGDMTSLDPLAAVSDLTAPLTGALPIKAREETVGSTGKTVTA